VVSVHRIGTGTGRSAQMMTIRIGSLVALGLLTVLAGCAGSGSPAALEDVEWRLVSSSVSAVDLGAYGITATFAGGTVGGSGGVNSYGAPYTVRGDALTVGDVTSTLIAALDEQANMAEAAYFGLLPEATSYEIDEAAGTLTLFDSGGSPILVFKRAE
jgi:heat shock protein HslJ